MRGIDTLGRSGMSVNRGSCRNAAEGEAGLSIMNRTSGSLSLRRDMLPHVQAGIVRPRALRTSRTRADVTLSGHNAGPTSEPPGETHTSHPDRSEEHTSEL